MQLLLESGFPEEVDPLMDYIQSLGTWEDAPATEHATIVLQTMKDLLSMALGQPLPKVSSNFLPTMMWLHTVHSYWLGKADAYKHYNIIACTDPGVREDIHPSRWEGCSSSSTWGRHIFISVYCVKIRKAIRKGELGHTRTSCSLVAVVLLSTGTNTVNGEDVIPSSKPDGHCHPAQSWWVWSIFQFLVYSLVGKYLVLQGQILTYIISSQQSLL